MTMDKARYKQLRFLDFLFPDMPTGLIVKVLDKRFRAGFYYGVIKNVLRTHHPFKVYIVRHLLFTKEYWVFRDHIEIPKKGNWKELM